MKLVAAPRSAIRPTIRQQREPDAAVGAAAEDESDATGYSQRGQRFLSYVFADVPLSPTQSFVRVRWGRPC